MPSQDRSHSRGVHPSEVSPLHCDSAPNVMLSPNASVRVFSSCGGAETVTLKLQETFDASTVAEHPTAVVPIANSDPLAGVQVAWTGRDPLTIGAWYVTGTALLLGETT